jgi:hypothetical protein
MKGRSADLWVYHQIVQSASLPLSNSNGDVQDVRTATHGCSAEIYQRYLEFVKRIPDVRGLYVSVGDASFVATLHRLQHIQVGWLLQPHATAFPVDVTKLPT